MIGGVARVGTSLVFVRSEEVRMRGRKLVTSVVMASALTVPFLMPTGAQAQLIGPLDLGNVLGVADSPFGGGGLLGVGGIGSEGGLLNSLLREATLLNNCGLPLLSGGCRAFSDDFEVHDVDSDVRFRRSPITIIGDPFDGHGRKHRDFDRCFLPERHLCRDGRFHDGKFNDGRFHDGRFNDGRFHDGRFFDPCCHDGRSVHSTPFVTHVPVGVPVGGQSFVSNNNNNNNNITVVGGGGGGASSSASSSSSS
jgi:hypothetical protein